MPSQSKIPIAQLVIAALLLALATGLGAYAAHGLDRILDTRGLANFGTAVDYQFFNALGVLAIGALGRHIKRSRTLTIGGWVLIAGIVLFSGSLYLGAFVRVGALGLIAPLGGLCLIGGWLLAAYAIATARVRSGH